MFYDVPLIFKDKKENGKKVELFMFIFVVGSAAAARLARFRQAMTVKRLDCLADDPLKDTPPLGVDFTRLKEKNSFSVILLETPFVITNLFGFYLSLIFP